MNPELALKWQPAEGRTFPTSARGIRTWEAIRTAAVGVFGRLGFAGAAVYDIAEEAGVASGTVYRYYVDKEDIFRSLLATVEEDLYKETTMPTDESGRLVVRQGATAYFNVYRRHAALYRVWRELIEPGNEFEHAWTAMRQRFQQGIATVVRHGQRTGVVNSQLDPVVVSELVVAMFDQPSYTRLDLGWDVTTSDEDVAEVMEHLLGQGLRAARAS